MKQAVTPKCWWSIIGLFRYSIVGMLMWPRSSPRATSGAFCMPAGNRNPPAARPRPPEARVRPGAPEARQGPDVSARGAAAPLHVPARPARRDRPRRSHPSPSHRSRPPTTRDARPGSPAHAHTPTASNAVRPDPVTTLTPRGPDEILLVQRSECPLTFWRVAGRVWVDPPAFLVSGVLAGPGGAVRRVSRTTRAQPGGRGRMPSGLQAPGRQNARGFSERCTRL